MKINFMCTLEQRRKIFSMTLYCRVRLDSIVLTVVKKNYRNSISTY